MQFYNQNLNNNNYDYLNASAHYFMYPYYKVYNGDLYSYVSQSFPKKNPKVES